MITIKNKVALGKMATAGKLLAQIFERMAEQIKPGGNALELDSWIARELIAAQMVTKMKGYQGYRHVSCISINDEVVHGVPTSTKMFKEGDLIKVDVCASWKEYCADMARPFFVGEVAPKIQQLVAVAEAALYKGIEQAVPGNHLGDISAAIQAEVEKHGFGVIRDFAGHGIGKRMHEDPEILNYGTPGKGPLLRAGMTFALEPMIVVGSYKIYITQDGWTVKTVDKSWAAHVEDTIVITQSGPKILTRL